MERLTSLKRILALPRDKDGWALTYDTGTSCTWVPPERKTRVGQAHRLVVERCWKERLCGVCGEKIGTYAYFMASRKELDRPLAPRGDVPLHRDCGRASMQICPALTNPDGHWMGAYAEPVLLRCREYDAKTTTLLDYELVEFPKFSKPSKCPVTAVKRFLGIDRGGPVPAVA